jgi:hypothetical protein
MKTMTHEIKLNLDLTPINSPSKFLHGVKTIMIKK